MVSVMQMKLERTQKQLFTDTCEMHKLYLLFRWNVL